MKPSPCVVMSVVLAGLLAGCGGGGSGEDGQKPPASAPLLPQVTGIFLLPWSGARSTSDEQTTLPVGSRSTFWVHGAVPQPNGTLSTGGSSIVGGACTTTTSCKMTDGFASVSTVSLVTSAPISLVSSSPLMVVVDPAALVGSTVTFTVTETTGRQISRTYEVR